MKILSLLLFFFALNICCTSQQGYTSVDFDDSSSIANSVFIDTVTNPSNIWQIGRPQKNVFVDSILNSNVIVTDTVNSYQSNDTSSFIIQHIAFLGFSQIGGYVFGQYYVNSDTLVDYGFIEFSPDNGLSWENIYDFIPDTTIDCGGDPRPVFSGNSNEWKNFCIEFEEINNLSGIDVGDTVLFKFSFISDNNQNNLDGLMFNYIYIQEYWLNVNEFKSSEISSSVYPNPSKGNFTIEFNNEYNDNFELLIYSLEGKKILEMENSTGNSFCVQMDKFNSGLYFYKLINTKTQNSVLKKIIIE